MYCTYSFSFSLFQVCLYIQYTLFLFQVCLYIQVMIISFPCLFIYTGIIFLFSRYVYTKIYIQVLFFSFPGMFIQKCIYRYYFSLLQVCLYIQILFFLLIFVCNGIMWTFFTKSLQYCSSSVEATVTNTASNFLCTVSIIHVN